MPSCAAAKINSKIPLVFAGLLFLLFGMSMILNPLGFLSQYSISVSHMTQADEMIVASLFQQWGICTMMMLGFCSIACRVASERTRMHINLAVAVSCCFNLVLFGVGFDVWTSVGCSAGGLMFNICICVILMILFVLGAGFSFELAPCRKPIYWGSVVLAVFCFTYCLMFLLLPEMVLNSYNVQFDSERTHVLILCIWQYGWSGLFFQMGVWLLAGLMTNDVMYIYALNRYIAMIQMGTFFVQATNVAWWTTKNTHGNLDDFIDGQLVGCAMSFAFCMLTYGPIIMLDTQIAQSVNEAIEGQRVSGPTLLSPTRQERSGYKEPLVG